MDSYIIYLPFSWQERFQFTGNVVKYRCLLLLAWQYRGITLFLEFLFTVFSFHLLLWFHLFLWLLLLLSLLLLSLYCSCFCDFCSKHCCFYYYIPLYFSLILSLFDPRSTRSKHGPWLPKSSLNWWNPCESSCCCWYFFYTRLHGHSSAVGLGVFFWLSKKSPL